jgi:hypothetical protein
VEGLIRAHQADAIAAEARIAELHRAGFGGNLGPPLAPPPPQTGLGPLSSRHFDGQAWINAYRTAYNTPNLFGQDAWPRDQDTVAVAGFEGGVIFGVNRNAPGYESRDFQEAIQWREKLALKYPDVIKTENAGWTPSNSFFHAESTMLMRAARESGGTLAGKNLEVTIDKDICGNCTSILPRLGLEMGNPTVVFTNSLNGKTWILRNGRLEGIK